MDGRPKTRGDCIDGPRPCPWVGCRYNLVIEATEAGSLRLNGGAERAVTLRTTKAEFEAWSDRAVERMFEMTHTCALDFADEVSGENVCSDGQAASATLEHVGEALGVTRERMRQAEASAVASYRRAENVQE